MKIIHDKTSNAWYIYLKDEIKKSAPARQQHLTDNVILDWSKEGELLGIEILE